ncbi:hypothetical protein Pint_03589 [Pistacia integerrima]|uniref:Uncharacterized protein n=1 Tax=Pistacia integerrima TaxID=434235 RepID=A0ACC0Z810_9ROSI|nr:hypothetical protein Pint_03589 [Pistacia integerrima]
MKVLGAFDSPKGITSHPPDPGSGSNRLSINEYTQHHQHVQSSMSSNRGIGNLYFIVLLLMARLSMHILQVPSFLGVSNAGTAQGLMLANKLLSNQLHHLSPQLFMLRWALSYRLLPG